MSDTNQEIIWLNNSAGISVRLSEFPTGSKNFGIDVRKWLNTDKYTGFTKKGIWIPVESKSQDPIALKVCIAFTKLLATHLNLNPQDLMQRVIDVEPESQL